MRNVCFKSVLLIVVLVKGLSLDVLAEKPNELSQEEWGSVMEQIQQTKYWPYKDKNDGYQAHNPAQQWQIKYQTNGQTLLSHQNGNIGMSLQSVDGLQVADYPTLQALKGKMYYHHSPDIKEWWVNSTDKIEQWFEIKQKINPNHIGLEVQLGLETTSQVTQLGEKLYFTTDNGQSINYDQLLVWDSQGQILDSYMLLAANQQSLTLYIDDSHAQYPVTIDPSFTQESYIKPLVLDPSDNFSSAVDISGAYLIVGTLEEDSNSIIINGDSLNNDANDAGAAYIFRRSGNAWVQEAYLKASNAESEDAFGESVAISGTTAVVGAANEDGDANSTAENPNNNRSSGGAAYVFVRNGNGTWEQQAYLKAHQTGADEFAETVDIDGNTIVVGSKWEDGDANSTFEDTNELAPNAGAAYVYTRAGTSWTQTAYLKASNAEFGDQFGYGVAIDGGTIVVTANGEDGDGNSTVGAPNNAASDAGAAYVFEKINNVWVQTAYLKAHNAGTNDLFGEVVDINENSIVIGAYQEDGDANSTINQDNNNAIDSGATYVFVKSNEIWQQQAYLKAGNADFDDDFGYSVAIDGNKILIGAPNEDGDINSNMQQSNNNASNAGGAYVFTRMNDVWQQSAYLKSANIEAGDKFGFSVAVDNQYSVVGARNEDGDVNSTMQNPNNNILGGGVVYVFESQFFIGGHIYGLPIGESVGLILNGNVPLTVFNNGYYQFPTEMSPSVNYSVGVASVPSGFFCSLVNPSGSVFYDDVTDVNVYCASDSYQVGVSVSGLTGNGLLLRANDVFDLNISSNGTHYFSTNLADGTPYHLEVINQPNDGQSCFIDVAEGVVNGADVVAAVTCSASSFDVGGRVSGLVGSLVLQNNGADNLSLSNNGPFTFANQVDDGQDYQVTILTQPATQTCVVIKGSGTVSGADVVEVIVDCTTDTYFVGGTVSGLNASGLTLQNNGGDDLSININGAFVFSQPLDDASQYQVTIISEPTSQQCQINNASGTINSDDVTDVLVNCQDNTFMIGVDVTGLTGPGLVVENNNIDTLSIMQNGITPFAESLSDGDSYDVQIISQPNDANNTCELLNVGQGVVSGNHVLINILCGNDLIFENGFE